MRELSLFTGIKEFEFLEKEYKKLKVPKRIHYDIPTYLKFYTIYQYDRNKFKEMMKQWIKTEEGQNRTYETLKAKQDEVLEQCYILDETGKRKRDCDEKHIFRYGALQNIRSQIYQEIMFKRIEGYRLKEGFIVMDYDGEQAEINNTWQLPLKDRIRLHLKLLRRLRENYTVE